MFWFFAVLAILWGALAVLLWQGAREHRATEAELATIRALSMAEAKALAARLLENADIFRAQPATGALSSRLLPQSVQELFARFERVEKGEFCLERAALMQSPRLSGYLKIGEDFEFTEVLVREGDESVYVSYGESADDELPEVVASVWHKIVEVSGIPLERLRAV